jgi:hypothetical protein
MRALRFVLPSLFVATVAQAQGMPVEKCTGNFEEAQLKEKRGKLVEAEQLYAACATSKCPTMITTDCSAKRDEMIRRIPTITVVVRDASGSDLESYVEIDGKPVQDRAHAQPIDPGEHVVNYRASGRKPSSQKITVVEGEKARVITITAGDGKDAEPVVPSAPGQEHSPSPAQRPPESHSIVAPVILGSIGVIALLAGVGLQVMAQNEDDRARDFFDRAKDPSVPPDQRDEFEQAGTSRREAAKNDQLLAIVVFSGGLVFIASGIVLYFVTKPSPSPSKSAFAPLVAPGFVGASYGLRF